MKKAKQKIVILVYSIVLAILITMIIAIATNTINQKQCINSTKDTNTIIDKCFK